jgi:hypothetical protein
MEPMKAIAPGAQIGGGARLRLRPLLIAHRERFDWTAQPPSADYALPIDLEARTAGRAEQPVWRHLSCAAASSHFGLDRSCSLLWPNYDRRRPTARRQTSLNVEGWEGGGRVPWFSTGVETDILVSSQPFCIFRRRSRQAARPVSTTACPHSTGNSVQGPS